jgi:hypothetical protein
MELVDTINQVDEIPRLHTFDDASRCHLPACTNSSAAIDNLVRLAEWWLADDQQRQLGVNTLIEVRQRSDRLAWDAIFKFAQPERALAVPVFFFLTQHFADKHYPHYQLQVPHGELGKNAAGPLKERVEELMKRCREETRAFRYGKLVSISMHDPGQEEVLSSVQGAVARMVRGLRDLYGGTTAPK